MLNCCSKSGDLKEVTQYGGMVINKDEDFKLGQGENIQLNDNNEIILKDNELKGFYQSPVIRSNKFTELVSSWNVNTPKDTDIEVLFQVKVEENWSMWFSYGKWSSNRDGGSIDGQKDNLASMSIDTLIILSGKEADAFKYQVVLTKKDSNMDSPRIRAISAALKLSEEIVPALAENTSYLVELDVPERSQMIIPEIGNVICSATSLAMVLEYYGKKMTTEEVAANVLDNSENIYGNWSYNVAYAGSLGFNAYVFRFSTLDEIRNKIAEGRPVIASIKTKSKEELQGAPQAYPSGHLVVARGFVMRDGEEYIIINDPAAPENEAIRREYKVSEFEKAWVNIVYILIP